MQFSDDVWDLFGVASTKAMDEFMDDDIYRDIRGSFEASMKKSSRWLNRSDSIYTSQRNRVLGG